MTETRVSSPSDSRGIASLQEMAFASVRHVYRPKQGAKPDSHANEHGVVKIVALHRDSLVGSITAIPERSHLRLSTLAVRPNHRRRGVARLLIAHAERLAVTDGCSTMILNTIRETGNADVFTRLGFVITNETVADWCTSESFAVLHDLTMQRQCG